MEGAGVPELLEGGGGGDIQVLIFSRMEIIIMWQGLNKIYPGLLP